MKPAPFAYHRARSREEAVRLLEELAPSDGRILAGGQSLVPFMAFRLSRPAHLIDINDVPDLNVLRVSSASLRIGATIRHSAFARIADASVTGSLLAAVMQHVAHPPIRSRGTFCGSLAHSDPASEWCLVFVTLGGTATAQSMAGTRSISAEAFFQGIMTTALAPAELLVETALALLPAGARWGFNEISRRAGDYAIAMTLAVYQLRSGLICEPRIGIGGAETYPRRIAEAERELVGQKPSPDLFRRAAEAAAAAIQPMEDSQADAAFRRDLVRATTRRALAQAAA